MTDREKTMERLMGDGVGECGLSRHEAELRLRDDDLWMLRPDQRDSLEGEEAVEAWRRAVNMLEWLSWDSPICINPAVQTVLRDARERAEEALRRAQARMEDVRA